MPPVGRRTIAVRLACVLAVALASSCTESPSRPERPVDVTIVLAPGQAQAIAGTGLTIRFVGVSGDSRCPADALCVLGGDAVVLIEASTGAAPVQLDLHTGNDRPVSHGRFTIALVELSPYPFSARPINPGDYRAKLRITG